MTTLRTAAQQALEAMDKATRFMSDSDYRKLNEAITALRAALSAEHGKQPEQEPVVVRAEALDLISEAAEVLDKVRVSCDAWEKYGLRDFLPDELAGTAGMLRDGLAFTHPPRREWRGLTEEEKRECAQAMDAEPLAEGWPELVKFARAIEQALKEKNA